MRVAAWIVGVAGAIAGVLFAQRVVDDPSSSSSTARLVRAKHFRRGTPGRAVSWIVLHTTENPCAPGVAASVAQWFATQPDTVTTSAHYVVGPDEAIQCVELDDVAWHAPPANEHGIGIEFTGRASFTADDWASPPATAMLERGAALVAELAAARNVPAVFVDAAGLVAGERGITTHREVARAWKKTDHVDPGDAFPLESFLEAVRARMPIG